MIWQFNPYAIPLFVGLIPTIGFALIAWQHRDNTAAQYFLHFALAVAGFMLSYGLEITATDLSVMLLCLRFEYIFSTTIPVFWLLFILAYTGQEKLLKPRFLVLLFVIPILHILAVWTNEYHGLNWQTVGTQTVNGLVLFDRTYGTMFYIGSFYLYGIAIVATIIMVVAIIRSPGIYRGQVTPLVLSNLFMLGGHILTITGLTIIPKLDLTPFGAALACAPIAWSLFRYKLLDIVPAAHSAIIRGMSDAVIVIDAQNRVIDLNPAAERLIEKRLSIVIGQPAATVFADVPSSVTPYIDRYEAQGELEFQQGGERRYFDLRISPLYDQRGKLTARIAALRDITPLKRAEETARQYATDLEERNSELDAFSHTIAHDLKAPISSIMGYNDMLLEFERPNLNANSIKYAEGVRRSTTKMLSMIDELLQLARIRDVGGAVSEVEMTPVAQAAVDRFQNEIETRGIRITIMPDMPTALGHAGWLEEVFANLISNAVKYMGQDNPSPCITIRGSRQDNVVRYEVQDNGLGIQTEDQKRLFQLFARFHESEAIGLGLGLSICLRIVKRLKGRVGVDSQPGQGSTFWFTLPAPESARAA